MYLGSSKAAKELGYKGNKADDNRVSPCFTVVEQTQVGFQTRQGEELWNLRW